MPNSILKRSRRARTEPTLYAETVKWADAVLADCKEDATLFGFSHGYALKLMGRMCERGGEEQQTINIYGTLPRNKR